MIADFGTGKDVYEYEDKDGNVVEVKKAGIGMSFEGKTLVPQYDSNGNVKTDADGKPLSQ
jgi:hypothetical protein